MTVNIFFFSVEIGNGLILKVEVEPLQLLTTKESSSRLPAVDEDEMLLHLYVPCNDSTVRGMPRGLARVVTSLARHHAARLLRDWICPSQGQGLNQWVPLLSRPG